MDDMSRKIDYNRFYAKYFKKMKVTGNEIMARCPFHNDTHASLSINTETGLWKCHACDKSGNAQTFIQEMDGVSASAAIETLKREAGISTEKPKIKFTLEEYARVKKLPLEFLKELKLRDNSKIGIAIPYMDESGAVLATRQRYSGEGSGPKFSWTRGSKVQLYGLWKLPEIRKAGYVILVEGESDTQTLWYHGYSALGVPGATVFQPHWVGIFEGLNIIIHQEPDIGGESFVRKICEALCDSQYKGNVRTCSIPGYKDPSALHIDSPDNFKEKWNEVIKQAKSLNIREMAVRPEELIPGAPIQARQPAGWRLDPSRGISLIDNKGLFVNICPVPVLLSKRLRSIDTGDEKIELVFKRDNEWKKIISNRSTVFQRRTIVQLADKGLPITSEKAGELVKYLGDMEAENLDILPIYRSIERLGWISKDKFLPGLADDVVLDIDSSMKMLADGYSAIGDFDDWKNGVNPIRNNPIARFIVAAAFTAPLLKLLNHRIFIVHNWGSTRIGKTAALKAALSVWGDPEVLMTNFNATRVGLERLAGFYNDLPLGIDERQVAGNKQPFIDSLIYLLGLGKGRTRGSKYGGIQNTSTWRCVILTTGEDPLISDNSLGGLKTRVLEVYGKPFNTENEAKKIHQLCAETYGHAGIMFLKEIISMENNENIKAIYQDIESNFSSIFEKNSGPHVSAVSLVSTADYFVSQWIFGIDEVNAMRQGLEMGMGILKKLDTTDSMDLVNKAWDFIKGWLVANSSKFKQDCIPPRYGYIDGLDRFCVIPSYLEKAFTEAGYSYRKTLMDFAERDYIETVTEGGKRRYSLVRRMPGSTTANRVVVLNVNKDEIEERGDNPERGKLIDGTVDDGLPF